MIIMMKRSWRLPSEWRWIPASLVMLTTWHCEANDLAFEFKYKVVAASCTLTVDSPNLTLGVNGHLDPTRLIGSTWAFIGESDVSVKLSGCAGSPEASTLPYVDVTPVSGTSALSASGLYRGDSSGSTGFGVVVGNKAGMSGLSANALVTTTMSRVQLEDSGAATNKTYYLRVGVTCGNTCDKSNLKAGTLNAAFTLDFNYH